MFNSTKSNLWTSDIINMMYSWCKFLFFLNYLQKNILSDQFLIFWSLHYIYSDLCFEVLIESITEVK